MFCLAERSSDHENARKQLSPAQDPHSEKHPAENEKNRHIEGRNAAKQRIMGEFDASERLPQSDRPKKRARKATNTGEASNLIRDPVIQSAQDLQKSGSESDRTGQQTLDTASLDKHSQKPAKVMQIRKALAIDSALCKCRLTVLLPN